jgi:predicted transcriptional regulator
MDDPRDSRPHREAKLLAVLQANPRWMTRREVAKALGFGAALPVRYIQAAQQLASDGLIDIEQRRTVVGGPPHFAYRAVKSEKPLTVTE